MASSSAAIVAILSLLVAVDAASAPAEAPSSASGSIQDTCKKTAHFDFCVSAFSSDPSSKTADTVGLARIAVKAAQKNASETANFLSTLKEKSVSTAETAPLQECLKNCGKRYESAVGQLSDAVAAIDSGSYSDAVPLVAGSQAEVKVCQKGCHAVKEHKNILTARNRQVDRLCSVALSITKLVHGASAPAAPI